MIWIKSVKTMLKRKRGQKSYLGDSENSERKGQSSSEGRTLFAILLEDEENQLLHLLAILSQVFSPQHDQNSRLWTFSKDGSLLVASLIGDSETGNPLFYLWKSLALPRVILLSDGWCFTAVFSP